MVPHNMQGLKSVSHVAEVSGRWEDITHFPLNACENTRLEIVGLQNLLYSLSTTDVL